MGVLVDMGVSPQAWVMPPPCSLLIWGSAEETRGAVALPGEKPEVRLTVEMEKGDRVLRNHSQWYQQSRAHTLQKDLRPWHQDPAQAPPLPPAQLPPKAARESPGGCLAVLWVGAALRAGLGGRRLTGGIPLDRTCREWS